MADEAHEVRDCATSLDCAMHFERFDRWLAARDREVAAKAWDEGFDTGYDQVLVARASVPGAPDLRKNPYAEGGR